MYTMIFFLKKKCVFLSHVPGNGVYPSALHPRTHTHYLCFIAESPFRILDRVKRRGFVDARRRVEEEEFSL
jgi:hypothetical protein